MLLHGPSFLGRDLLRAHLVGVNLLRCGYIWSWPLFILRQLSVRAGELWTSLRVEVDARVIHLARLLDHVLPFLLGLAGLREITWMEISHLLLKELLHWLLVRFVGVILQSVISCGIDNAVVSSSKLRSIRKDALSSGGQKSLKIFARCA